MKRRPWKLVLSLIGGMVLIVGLVVADVHRRTSAILDAQGREVEKRIQEFMARDAVRQTPYGPELDGNAWDDYGPAIDALAAIPDDLANLIPEVQGITDEGEEPPVDDHALHNLYREHQVRIDAIRRGAQHRLVRVQGLSFDLQAKAPFVAGSPRTAYFLAGRVRHLHRMGNDREALETAFLGLMLAQDFGRTSQLLYSLIQCMIEGHIIESARTVLMDHSLSAADLEAAATLLDRLDAGRPDLIDAIVGEGILIRRGLLHAPWDEWVDGRSLFGRPPVSSRPSWRCLFSERISRAEALGYHERIVEQLSGLRSVPPWRRAESALASLQDPERSANPLVRRVGTYYPSTFRNDARTQLERTLLRVALAMAWYEVETGQPPARLEELLPRRLSRIPLCPMTGLPLATKDGRVWSPGENRVDDGGTPGVSDQTHNEDGDVVWTVKRK